MPKELTTENLDQISRQVTTQIVRGDLIGVIRTSLYWFDRLETVNVNNWKQLHLSESDIPLRIVNMLGEVGIKNIGQLTKTSDDELLGIRFLGDKRLEQLRATVKCAKNDHQECEVVRFTIPGPWSDSREWIESAQTNAGNIPESRFVKALNWTAFFPVLRKWGDRKKRVMIGHEHRHVPTRDAIDNLLIGALYGQCVHQIPSGTTRKLWDLEARVEVEIEVEMDGIASRTFNVTQS